jgi:hypothetical protein
MPPLHLKKISGSILSKLVRRREETSFIIVASLLFLFVYRSLPINRMFAYGDLPPFPGNYSLFWNRFASVWQNEHLGFPLPEISFQVIVEIMIFIFGDPNAAQKILLLSAMPFAMVSMYVFVGRFVRSNASRFLASIVYGLNPVIIGRFVNGGPDGLFLYALMPLLWLQLTKVIARHRILDVLLFAVLFGIVGSRIYAIFWAVVPFTVMLIIVKLSQKGYRNKSFLLGLTMVLLSFLLGVLLILPDILLTFQRSETLVPQFDTFMKAVDWAYSTPNPLNLMWLGGNGGDLMMRLLGYNDISLWTLLGLIVPLIAFSSTFLAETKKREHVSLFLALVVAVMSFILLTRLKLTYPLFQAFPPLFSLKNPVKLMYPMSLALCSLFGIGLEGIMKQVSKNAKIPSKNARPAILSAFLLVLMISFLFPVLGRGTVGLDDAYGSSYYIPLEYETVLNWINEQRESHGSFRTLWLPYDYSMQIKLEAADPQNVGLRSGAAWVGIPNIDFVKDFFEMVCKGNLKNFSEILTILDVKYVIIDLNAPQTAECTVIERQVTPWIVGNPIHFVNFIEHQDHLDEVLRVGNLVIYENRQFAASYFSIYDNLVFLTSPRLNGNISIASSLTSNLLRNLGFESGLTSWWTDKIVSVDDRVFSEGGHSARINNNDTERWASIVQSTLVKRGGTYQFSAWVKTQDSNSPHIKLEWSDENRTTIRTDYIVEKGEIEGAIDWLRKTEAIKAPENAVAVSIKLIGGLSLNAETVATTWFDNVELYEIPAVPSDSFAQNFLTLTNVPGFISAEHLVVFEKGLSHDEILEALNVSDIIAFSHPTIDQLKECANLIHDQKLLQIFEAETLSAPGRRLLLDNSMSNGEAIALNKTALSLEFHAPISGYYQIGFNGLSGNVSIFVNDIPLTLTTQHETEALHLEKGNHTLRITGENTVLDQIQILSAKNVEDLDNIFGVGNSANDIINIESGTGHYSIEAELSKPSFLVLGESYDPDWKANLDTENLKHFRAFGWSNAFYVQKTGKTKVEISFVQQPLRDISINLWGLFWIVITETFVLVWIQEKRRGRTGKPI